MKGKRDPRKPLNMLQGWPQQCMSRTDFTWTRAVRTIAVAYYGGDLNHSRSAVLGVPKLLADSPPRRELLAPFGELPGAKCWAGWRAGHEMLSHCGKPGQLLLARHCPEQGSIRWSSRQARYIDHPKIQALGASAACHASAFLPSCDRPSGPLHPSRILFG
jgi:hypothetical protein